MLQNLTLAKRFSLLSLLILLAVAMPTGAFMHRVIGDLNFIRSELAGVGPTVALLKGVKDIQQHRLQSVLQLSGQAEAQAPRAMALDAARQSLMQALDLAPTGADWTEAIPSALKALDGLAKAVAENQTTSRESFDAHSALLRQLDDVIAKVLAESGLLLDPEASNYFFIIAGFQEGKTVIDQLAQLHDLGYTVLRQKGASPLDLNQLAAVKARLEDRERFVVQNMGLAKQIAGDEWPTEIGDRLAQAQKGVATSLDKVNLTFLGMSPDWDVKPEDYAATLQSAIQSQRAFTDAVVTDVQQRLEARARTLTLVSGTLMVALLGLLGLLSWRLWSVVQAIINPLGQLARKGDQMAQGDLTPTFESDERNELGQLIHSLEGMRQRWIDVLGQVTVSARDVQTATDEISAENKELSVRTEQSAARLQASSHMVQRLSDDVATSAQAAQEAGAMARNAAAVAGRGASAMSAVEATMGEIHERSRRISDITGVIDGIAFQTNILALNAAVEAARAGDQGRGFAVVAAEVRTLAKRSADAAKEIKTLITASAERIEAGNAEVRDAGTTMRELAEAVALVNDVIQSIGDASQRQRTDIAQVQGDVTALDEMTQRNAAVAEQSAAASETLASLAQRLGQAVAQFRLPERH